MNLIITAILIVAVLLVGYALGKSNVEVIEKECPQQKTNDFLIESCNKQLMECAEKLYGMESE